MSKRIDEVFGYAVGARAIMTDVRRVQQALARIIARLQSVTSLGMTKTFPDTYRLDSSDGSFVGSIQVKGKGSTLQAYLFAQPKKKP
jgi:hypothetical protein